MNTPLPAPRGDGAPPPNAAAVTLRAFAPADEPAVIALWQACGLTRPWNDPRLDIARKLRQQPELFLVGDFAGVVGASAMVGYEGHRGWINYLAVDPRWQRRGIARRLMAEAESRLRALGCPKLNLQVRAGNVEALAFYRALGYQPDDVVCLGRRLLSDE